MKDGPGFFTPAGTMLIRRFNSLTEDGMPYLDARDIALEEYERTDLVPAAEAEV